MLQMCVCIIYYAYNTYAYIIIYLILYYAYIHNVLPEILLRPS